MRLKSVHSLRILSFTYILSLVLLLADIVILNFEGSFGGVMVSPFAIVISIILLLRGHPKFEYDSDGEVLNITTESPFFKWLGGKKWRNHVEFPKRKLASFEMPGNFFKRKLIIHIKSKEGYLKKRVFTISYLKSKDVKDLRHSLNKVLHNNKSKNGSGSGKSRQKQSSGRAE